MVQRALEPFADPRVWAVAIPYVERGRGETEVRQHSPRPGALYATGPYIGTAHAVRIADFTAAGGYRGSLVRNTEELDLWTRMLDRGRVVVLGWGSHIDHHESPKRVVADVVYYDCRNNLLHAWRNVPLPYALGRAAKVAIYALAVVTRSTGQRGAVGRGLLAGVAGALRAPRERRPVSRAAYRLGRRIRHHGPVALADLPLPPAPGAAGPAPAARPAAPAAPHGR